MVQDSFMAFQNQVQNRLGQWKQDWNRFSNNRLSVPKLKAEQKHLQTLNGGRWLFGADDIYRLSHLEGISLIQG